MSSIINHPGITPAYILPSALSSLSVALFELQFGKEWYNGYNFRGEPVYNPFDILLFIDSVYEYRNYWFATGTPSFLIKLVQQQDYFIPQLANLWADMEAVQKTITILFPAIPYNNYVKNTIGNFEGYYASVIYAYLASLGLDIIAEDVTSRGRIDLTVTLGENIFILEFKVDGKGDALQQIKEKITIRNIRIRAKTSI